MKLSIVVTLLIGEHPDLKHIASNRNLAPYRELATAVMLGDLNAFKSVMDSRMTVFKKERYDRVIAR